ncbi:HAD-IA family hydrolase [uncultured Halopseudomonas sp.]|uniref:HAD-IA family hydrolase n=1 Tax=uncultured Halopseudomonas sp. TaxID=2901193 RepID=UPI0030ED6CA9|tara:strand:- start:5403 stop:6071 length:669 start_codon:yes stop_codon:yes gene_type:complete
MPELKTLIFDWDGTLCDSISRIVESMVGAAKRTGLDVPSERAVRDIIGLGLPEAIAILFPGLDEPWLAEKLRQEYSEHYIALEQQPAQLFPGVIEALDNFRSAGFKMAVATGKSRRGLDRVLSAHGLTGFFDMTRCADETLSKPHPRMLEEILNRLETPASCALMLGDSEFDIRMAHGARVRAVAASYGAQSREHLLQSRPEHCIDAFTEFPGLVMPGSQAI